MIFSDVFQSQPFFFYDGPMETRIEFGTNIKIDKEMSIFMLMNTQEGRDALAKLYRTDIQTALSFRQPIILNAPVFRASKEHCKRLNIPLSTTTIFDINRECIEFVKAIRDEYPQDQNNIFITAPIGPKFAGFTPDKAHSLEEEIQYHQEQIDAVSKIGVDFISIAAMPGGLECMGAAIAASRTSLAYTVGFVIIPDGTLLDGTSIDQLIRNTDKHCQQKPLGYIIGCSHPSVAKQVLSDHRPEYERIIGIKANGSAKPPKALLNLIKPEADEPVVFAKELFELPLKLKIVGGCCGTDHRHLAAILKKFRSM